MNSKSQVAHPHLDSEEGHLLLSRFPFESCSLHVVVKSLLESPPNLFRVVREVYSYISCQGRWVQKQPFCRRAQDHPRQRKIQGQQILDSPLHKTTTHYGITSFSISLSEPEALTSTVCCCDTCLMSWCHFYGCHHVLMVCFVLSIRHFLRWMIHLWGLLLKFSQVIPQRMKRLLPECKHYWTENENVKDTVKHTLWVLSQLLQLLLFC